MHCCYFESFLLYIHYIAFLWAHYNEFTGFWRRQCLTWTPSSVLLDLERPISLSQNQPSQKISNKERVWKKPSSNILCGRGGSSLEVASVPSPPKAYHTWAQNQLMEDMSWSITYKIFELPALVLAHDFFCFFCLNPWGWITHPGVALLKINKFIYFFNSAWSGLLCWQTNLLSCYRKSIKQFIILL